VPVFNNVSNIFLVYPAYAGGNHLTNLLSLSEKIEPSFLSPKELKSEYQRLNREQDIDTPMAHKIAHFNEPENFANSWRVLDNDLRSQIVKQQSDGYISVVQGHMNNWIDLYQDEEKIKELMNPVWMFMSWPKFGPALERIKSKKDAFEKESDWVYPSADTEDDIAIWKCHKKLTLNKPSPEKAALFNVQPGNRIIIDTELFFEESGFEYFSSIVKGYFGIELPYHMGNSIHQLWRELLGLG